MLLLRHLGLTTGRRSGSCRVQQSVGTGSSWRSADGFRTAKHRNRISMPPVGGDDRDVAAEMAMAVQEFGGHPVARSIWIVP